MNYLKDFFGNEVLMCALLSWVVAQALKVLLSGMLFGSPSMMISAWIGGAALVWAACHPPIARLPFP